MLPKADEALPHNPQPAITPHTNCTPYLGRELDIIDSSGSARFRLERVVLAWRLPAVHGNLEQVIAGLARKRDGRFSFRCDFPFDHGVVS